MDPPIDFCRKVPSLWNLQLPTNQRGVTYHYPIGGVKDLPVLIDESSGAFWGHRSSSSSMPRIRRQSEANPPLVELVDRPTTSPTFFLMSFWYRDAIKSIENPNLELVGYHFSSLWMKIPILESPMPEDHLVFLQNILCETSIFDNSSNLISTEQRAWYFKAEWLSNCQPTVWHSFAKASILLPIRRWWDDHPQSYLGVWLTMALIFAEGSWAFRRCGGQFPRQICQEMWHILCKIVGKYGARVLYGPINTVPEWSSNESSSDSTGLLDGAFSRQVSPEMPREPLHPCGAGMFSMHNLKEQIE